MVKTVQKRAGETLILTVPSDSRLRSGETIASVAVTADTGLSASVVLDGTELRMTLSGGTAGNTYAVTVTQNGSDGQILESPYLVFLQ